MAPTLTPRIHICAPYGLSTLAADVASELHDLELDVVGPSESPPDDPVDALVVILSADGRPRDQALEERLGPWRSVVVPVVPDSVAAPTFKELSQLRIGRIGVRAAAHRIADIARFGGPVLADLFRLELAATRWAEAGRPTSLLPRGSTADTNLNTVTAAIGLASGEANAFVRAGLARRRLRRRRLILTAGFVACALFTGSTVAVVQRANAAQATAISQRRTAQATSDRLARLALQTQGLDPDLPWLLANQALDTARTPQAYDAARRVLTTIPPHVSVRLSGLPDNLSADPGSNTIAVHYVDRSTEIRSGADGRLLRTFSQPTHLINLAPGGRTILLDQAFVDVVSGQTMRRLAPDEQFRGWGGPNVALVRVGGKLGELDLTSGALRKTTVALSASDNSAWSLAAHAPIANLLDDGKLISVDLTSGTALPAVTVDDAHDVATSDDGSRVMVARLNGPSHAYRRTSTTLTTIGGAGNGTSVIAAGSSWVLGGLQGQVDWTTSDEGTVAFTYIAHRGPTIGVGLVGAGRTVTVGGDRYLRIWSAPPEQLAYPAPGTDAQEFDPLDLDPSTSRYSNRSLVALSPDGRRLTYVVQSNGVGGTVDPDDLHNLDGSNNFGFLTMVNVPLPSSRIAHFGTGTAEVVDAATASTLWKRKVAGLAPSLGIFTGSPDGQRLAEATFAGLLSFGPAGNVTATAFASAETPVAVFLDGHDAASAVTSDGHWYRESAGVITLAVGGSVVAAAGLAPDGTLYVLQENGTLSAYIGRRLVHIATVGADLQAFALRFSPDGSLIAVLGAVRGLVLNSRSGRLVADLTPTGSDSSAVRDVALTDTTVWEIRGDGGIVRRPILADDAVAAAIGGHLPRAITPQESAPLAGAVDTIGQHQ